MQHTKYALGLMVSKKNIFIAMVTRVIYTLYGFMQGTSLQTIINICLVVLEEMLFKVDDRLGWTTTTSISRMLIVPDNTGQNQSASHGKSGNNIHILYTHEKKTKQRGFDEFGFIIHLIICFNYSYIYLF